MIIVFVSLRIMILNETNHDHDRTLCQEHGRSLYCRVSRTSLSGSERSLTPTLDTKVETSSFTCCFGKRNLSAESPTCSALWPAAEPPAHSPVILHVNGSGFTDLLLFSRRHFVCLLARSPRQCVFALFFPPAWTQQTVWGKPGSEQRLQSVASTLKCLAWMSVAARPDGAFIVLELIGLTGELIWKIRPQLRGPAHWFCWYTIKKRRERKNQNTTKATVSQYYSLKWLITEPRAAAFRLLHTQDGMNYFKYTGFLQSLILYVGVCFFFLHLLEVILRSFSFWVLSQHDNGSNH